MRAINVDLAASGASSPLSTTWGDFSAHSHVLQFYEDDGFLIDSLSGWFGDVLSAGDACVYIGTGAHRISLEKRLGSRGLNLDTLRAQDRYVCLDAPETLSHFMVDEWPDEALFIKAMDNVVTRVSPSGKIRAFGEMVALLYMQRNREAAIRLEEIWNAFIKTREVSLCCAYPLNSFSTDPDASLFMKICAEHTPVLPAESYSALITPAERLRSISLLQHKATVLESEKAGRTEAQKSLHLSQKELSDFVENAAEALHQIGPDGKILWANPAQLKLLGYSAEEYVGHYFAEFYIDHQRFDQFWQQLMLTRVVRDFQASLRCKNGSVKHVLIHSSGLWVERTFLYTRCFIRDVTERIELEQELKARLAELAEADKRKNEFLAMLGHELRNPLSAVLDAVATAQLDPTRRERALIIARRQTRQLAALVDDLLDAGRITQGRITLKKDLINVGNLIKEAVEEVHCLVEPGHHELCLTVSPQAEDLQIDADPTRLRQVIANLIDNAAKFTPPGGRIDVLVQRSADHVILRVRDSGVGIAPELLPRIFDLFMQSERALDRSHGGLGIGLTVVKRLVEMHGGRIQAKSGGPECGSEFEVHLPILTTARPQAIAAGDKTEAGGGVHVLVIEDDRDAAEALTMLLELFGHQTTVVSDGLAAIDAAGKGGFDLALVDIGLPGIDGYEVARRIRMLETARTMMLVALTGYGQEADRERAWSAGFDEHLVKPVNVERLQALLSRRR
jgi:PAS domain S-box-containing protein